MPGPTPQISPFAEQLTMMLGNQDTAALTPAQLKEFLNNPQQLNAFKSSNAIFLTHYQNELARINPASLAFLTDAKKALLREKLQNILFVLTSQLLIDNMDKRRYHKKELDDAIAQCLNYQRQVEGRPPIDNAPPANALPVIDAATSPVKYLGLLLARWLAKQINYVPNGNTGTIKGWLNDINKWRLYWVWSSGFLMPVLDSMPQDFFNLDVTKHNLQVPSHVLGYISWTLYYLRFGLNLFLFIKHSLPGKWSWMSEEEKLLPAWDRAKAQWQQRKFSLLNDAAWGTVNLLGFVWLIGSTSLVYAGNVLIAGLLIVDILLSSWRFLEERAQFTHAKKILDNKITDLDDSIVKLNYELQNIENRIKAGIKTAAGLNLDNEKKKLTEQLAAARRQREELVQLLKTTKTNWKFKRASIFNDLAYSSGLLVGWCLIGGVFFPPATAAVVAQSAMMAMGLAGGIFCFVLTVTYQAIICYLEVAKIRNTIQENTAQLNKLQAEFDTINASINAQDLDEYELCARAGSSIDKNKLYVEFFAESIVYTVKDPRTNEVVTGLINSRSIDSTITTPLTIDKFRPHLTLAKLLDKIPAIPYQNRVQIAQQETQRESLFLEIKSLEATSRYQKRMINHQKLKFLRATIIDALIPAVIFASLVFLPTGIGVGILAAALALVVISKIIFNKIEPKPEKAPEFNENEADYKHSTAVTPASVTANPNTLFNQQRTLAQRLAAAEDTVDPYEDVGRSNQLDLIAP